MKYAIGWLTCQTLFWLGHLASKTFTNRQAIAYSVYRWLMIRSSEVDEWARCGLWKRSEDAD